MRILIVTEHFWPEDFRINDLASGLRERGHDVSVVTGMPNYPKGRYFDGYGLRGPWRERVDGNVVHRVPIFPRGNGRAWRLALNYASYALLGSLWARSRRASWDAVLVFQPSPATTIIPALAARRAGVPVVTWILDLWPDTLESTGMVRNAFLVRAISALSAWLYRRCDHVLGQSPAYTPRLEELGVAPERIGYLPSWAEELYEAPPAPASRGATQEPWERGFSVMFAGNLGRVQALDVVLDAAERLRDRTECHWVFVGDGAQRGWLEAEVERRRLAHCVHLVGRRPVEEMPSWFARASAMLVSLKREPILAMTIPGKIQSYLAAGAPIIGSLDGEGARVITESGAGFASPAEDAAALAASVDRMMSLAPQDRAELGKRGRAYYREHFARRAALDRVESTLQRAVDTLQLETGAAHVQR
jgi:colanic acid biosynthesis glycosyl transferase WcaI